MRLSEFLRDRMTMLILGTGVFCAAMYVALLAIGAGEDWASDASWIPYCSALILSVIVLALVVKFYGWKAFEGKVWMLIFAGIVLWAAAELITATDILLGVLDAGSLPALLSDNADYPFLAGYAVIASGFIYKAMNTPVKPDAGKAFLVFLMVGLFAIVAVFLVLIPLAETSMYTGSEKFFLVAYIVLDILLFGFALAIAIYWGTAVSKGWYIIAAGLLSMMIADVGYTALDLRGIYFDGSLIELAWVFAYLFIALAGQYQKKLHESFM